MNGLNKDVFNYKSWLITAVLLLGYAYMHVRLTGLYSELPFTSWLNFTAPLPFGQRQLIPFLARFLKKITSLKAYEIFFLLEILFVVLTFFILKKLLQLEFNYKLSLLLSWLFFLLLPLCSIINYRLVHGGQAPFFYPYDTATLFFMILGLYLCLKQQWFWLTVCTIFATLNRESGLLLVLLIPALYYRSSKQLTHLILPFFSSLFAYMFVRIGMCFLTLGLPRHYMEWYYYKTSMTNFSVNMHWLFYNQDIIMFMFAFAGLPLFWFLFYDYIPLKYRPIRYITFFYFLGLLVLGLIREARIFGEIIALIYVPICVAISNWLHDQDIDEQQHQGLLYFLNRYAIFILIIVIISTYHLIDSKIRQFIPVPAGANRLV